MDMREVAIGSKVRLRDGGKGRYVSQVGLEGGEIYLYEEEGSCDVHTVWGSGRIRRDSESPKDVIDEVEGEEYLERLNELSTENILLRKMLEKALGRVRCSDITGKCCSECYMRSGEERLGCVMKKLEDEVRVEIYGVLK